MAKRFLLPLIAFFLITLLACRGTLQVGIEQTPAPDHAATATLTALRAENAILATRVAALTTPVAAIPNLGKVAFVQGGDIWIKSLRDAKLERVTTDGRNSEPRWSSSGDWVAFRKERQVLTPRFAPCEIPSMRQENCRDLATTLQKQLWVAETLGNRTRVLNQGLTVDAFAWSPLGDQLAFVSEGVGLRLFDPDSATLTTLVALHSDEPTFGRVGKIAWSPDATRIAYEWLQSDSAAAGIWLVTINPTQRTQVYVSDPARRGDAILGGWMPDNQSIFFWHGETRATLVSDGVPLFATRADQNSATPARLADASLAYADFVAPAPARSNAGSRNLVAVASGLGAGTWANKRVETTKTLTPPGIAAIAPQWSPSGAQIAFVAMPQRLNLSIGDDTLQELMQRRIWIANAFGEREPQRVTNNASYRDERPLWSADGNYILFARLDRQGRASLWLITVNNNVTQLMIDELTPAPDPFGFYGHVDWGALFDWWRGAAR